MNSLTQQYLSAHPAPDDAPSRRRRVAHSQGHARGLRGDAYSRQTASPEFAAGQADAYMGPRIDAERERRARLGGTVRPRDSLVQSAYRLPERPQSAVDVSRASNEADSPRPQGIFQAFVKTCERWRLDPDQQAALLGLPSPSTLGAYVLNGLVLSPSVDVRERATRVFEISLGLGTLFDEDPEVENEWLRTPRARFANEPPLDHMLKGHMDHLLAVAELVHHERGL